MGTILPGTGSEKKIEKPLDSAASVAHTSCMRKYDRDGEVQRLNARLPLAVYEALRKVSDKNPLWTMNWIIQQAVRQYVNRRLPPEERV